MKTKKREPAPIDDGGNVRKLARTAAEDMLRRMQRTDASDCPIETMFEETGGAGWPRGNDDPSFEVRTRIIEETFARFSDYMLQSGHLADALLRAVECPAPKQADTPLGNAVRTFFLTPQRTYTHAEIVFLFSEKFADEAFEMSAEGGAPKETAVYSWRDIAYTVFVEVPAASLEDILGPHADLLPAGYRTELVTMRLPRHVIADLKEKAQEYGRPTIAAVIENNYGKGEEPIEPWRPRLAGTGNVVMVATPWGAVQS